MVFSLITHFRAKICALNFYLNTFGVFHERYCRTACTCRTASDRGLGCCSTISIKEVQDPADLQQRLLDLVKTINLCGTLIVAGEGINGTVAGTVRQLIKFINFC